MPFSVLEQIADEENLYWAWKKAYKQALTDSSFSNLQTFAVFEASLDLNLERIRRALLVGEYRPRPVRPIAQPKKIKDNKLPLRQMFGFSVEDQIVWLAVVNILGPAVDAQMPPWSYGSRLYRPAWVEEIDNTRRVHLGPYRNASGNIYRTWIHSWPLFKRHIHFTYLKMIHAENEDDLRLSRDDRIWLELEALLPYQEKLQYLRPNYWKTAKSHGAYYLSIDLEKFYPSVPLKTCVNNLLFYSGCQDTAVANLLGVISDIEIETPAESQEFLSEINLLGQTVVTNIPTGLFVSGFLANCAMLPVDSKVKTTIVDRSVAHFRYVDDHFILATSLSDAISWVKYYESLLVDQFEGQVKINDEKFKPIEYKEYLENQEKSELDLPSGLLAKAHIDKRSHKPLLTTALERVSEIAKVNFELMTDDEQARLLLELTQLMSTDLPDIELREDTRLSFSASSIARFISARRPNIDPWENRDVLTQQAIANLFSKFDEHVKEHAERILSVAAKYPDKLRLWEKSIQIASRLGCDIKELQETIKLVGDMNIAAGVFVSAYVYQCLAIEVLNAVDEVLDIDSSSWTRAMRLRFISAVARQRADKFLPDYSWDLGGATASNSLLILDAALHYAAILFERDSVSLTELPSVRSILAEYRTGAAGKIFKKRIEESGREVIAFLWKYSDHFSLTDVERLGLKPTKFTVPLSLAVESAIREGRKVSTYAKDLIAQHGSALEDGVKLELTAKIPSLKAHLWNGEKPTKRDKLDGAVDLYIWARFSAHQQRRRPEDPRCGEWTALGICLGIANDLKRRSDLFDIPSAAHPYFSFVPRTWIDPGYKNAQRWDFWTTEFKNELLLKQSDPNAGLFVVSEYPTNFEDSRYWIRRPERNTRSYEWAKVKSIGMILIGLLRQSFEFDPIFYNPYQSNRFRQLLYRVIGDLSVSSVTHAILSGIFSEKNDETLKLKANPPLFPWSIDTEYDPPEIYTLNDLASYLELAMGHLERYQYTGFEAVPLQLIPVALDLAPKQLGWQSDDT